jgi:hypothetical protein
MQWGHVTSKLNPARQQCESAVKVAILPGALLETKNGLAFVFAAVPGIVGAADFGYDAASLTR